MTTYTQVFGAGTILPGDVSYQAISAVADISLSWPKEANSGTNVAAAWNDVTTTGGTWSLTLDDATGVSTGYAVTFYNAGSNTFYVKDNGGSTLATVTSGTAWVLVCRSNSTAAGAWRTFQMGAGTSAASASALAGNGLVASGSLLSANVPTDALSVDYTLGSSDRAKFKNWTGGTGTLTLTQAATLTSGWYCLVRNSGTGAVTLARSGADVINGSATSFTVNVGESTWIMCDGTGFYTCGYGRALSGTGFALLAIDVSGTGDYTISGAQLNQVGYKLTGTLTGARNFIVPSTVAQYWIDNQTTGAYTLTVKTAAGTGVVVNQSQRLILYADGTNVVNADLQSLSTPISIANGGTGATTAASARTSLGSTATGDALFTAASAAAARSTLGSTATGDSLFTAASASAARTTLGSTAIGDALFVAADATAVFTQIGQNNLTAGTLLGRTTASAGNPQTITVGSGLSMSGTTLSATGTSVSAAAASDFWTGTDNTKFVSSKTSHDAAAFVAVAYATPWTPDFTAGINFNIGTLTGNLVINNPSAATPGYSGIIRTTQDATGGRSISFGTAWKKSSDDASAVSTSANAVNWICYTVYSTTEVLYTIRSGIA